MTSRPSAAPSDFDRAGETAQHALSRTKLRPQIGVVLGSGLGAFADQLEDAVAIPYAELPHFPRTSAEGHAGKLVIGKAGGVAVAALQGRVHLYEGFTLRELVFPTRVLFRMGARGLLLTNAAGAINREYRQGGLVLLRDHINLLGSSPVSGPNDERFGPRFFDMGEAYCPHFRAIAREEAARLGLTVWEGVYAAVPGPNYETPAEIGYLRAIGADLVGMSTVPETIAARHMGMRVLAISCVTNAAAGTTDAKLSHQEVLETGRRVAGDLLALLRAVLPRMAADLGERT